MDIIEANNHAFLVALVKKQAAQLEAVRALAEAWSGEWTASMPLNPRQGADDLRTALEAS